MSVLETKYLVELKRAPRRGELMEESVGSLKAVLYSRGWPRGSISGIEKHELASKALPYLDPNNQFWDDEPYPLASNCVTQFVLRALLLTCLMVAVHSLVGLSATLNALLLSIESLALFLRNLYIRAKKRDRMRKLV